MRWTSLLAIYILFWAFRSSWSFPSACGRAGRRMKLVPGQAESAPHSFSLRRVLIRTTIMATILFALFVANYEYGWVGTQSFAWPTRRTSSTERAIRPRAIP
ncbi:DUF1467 family protein [Sphingomonas sp. MMS24-JH45]